MDLQQRIQLMVQLGQYMQNNDHNWQSVKNQATTANSWFTEEFVEIACQNIIHDFLGEDVLKKFVTEYNIPNINTNPKNIGIIMAGNLPLVGFHDFVCAFLSGHFQTIKLSSKDNVLLKHLVQFLYKEEVTVQNYIGFAEILKNCDAYIATGSNNSSRYFEEYFGKYPNIIRKNRTSVAIINGDESVEELENLCKDIALYYGLGCRNITKIYVPLHYNFEPLLQSLQTFEYFIEHHKYKHNYDYHLALLMMSNKFYMTNGSVVLVEYKELFSPVSQLHYEYYSNKEEVISELQENYKESLQCIVGKGFIPFGNAQNPQLNNYADGVDIMEFLLKL
jgi:Acyl-CoA reductase (LuxC)